MKIGDVVAIVAQPIARAVDSALGTDLANCTGCHDVRRPWLNKLGDDVLDFFAARFKVDSSSWKPMQFLIMRSKQTLVEADTPEKAQEAEIKGQGQLMSSSITVQPRPQQPPQGPVMQPGR